ncbi:uncharacterized protein LOC135384235 [Ornithodoros turicata]|uniref:uncharacterized protein LOC135384235 n=1 Tax=Ornithodoros turicata TaxID=34597 RepID=UPI003139805F
MTNKLGLDGSPETTTTEDYVDIWQKADEEIQGLVGVIMVALICVVVGAILLLGCLYLTLEICKDLRHNCLVLWDYVTCRDPRYRVLVKLARESQVRIPSYERYRRWKRGRNPSGAPEDPTEALAEEQQPLIPEEVVDDDDD